MPCKECIKAHQARLRKNHLSYKQKSKFKPVTETQSKNMVVNKSIDVIEINNDKVNDIPIKGINISVTNAKKDKKVKKKVVNKKK